MDLRSLRECSDFRNLHGLNAARSTWQRLQRSTIPFLHFVCEHVFVVVRAGMCVAALIGSIIRVDFKNFDLGI
jgi:hypothetical protein